MVSVSVWWSPRSWPLRCGWPDVGERSWPPRRPRRRPRARPRRGSSTRAGSRTSADPGSPRRRRSADRATRARGRGESVGQRGERIRRGPREREQQEERGQPFPPGAEKTGSMHGSRGGWLGRTDRTVVAHATGRRRMNCAWRAAFGPTPLPVVSSPKEASAQWDATRYVASQDAEILGVSRREPVAYDG